MRTCMGYTVSVWTRGPPLSPPGPAPHRPLHRPQFGFRAFRADRPRGRAKPKKNTDRAINWRLIARRRPEVLVNTASSQIYRYPTFRHFHRKSFHFDTRGHRVPCVSRLPPVSFYRFTRNRSLV